MPGKTRTVSAPGCHFSLKSNRQRGQHGFTQSLQNREAKHGLIDTLHAYPIGSGVLCHRQQ